MRMGLRRGFGSWAVRLCALWARGEVRSFVESARALPVCQEADVVVVGGSCGAVAAVEAAARSGAKVFLVAPRPYLGDDVAGCLRLWRRSRPETLAAPLARALFVQTNSALPSRIPRVFRPARATRTPARCSATGAASRPPPRVWSSPGT